MCHDAAPRDERPLTVSIVQEVIRCRELLSTLKWLNHLYFGIRTRAIIRPSILFRSTRSSKDFNDWEVFFDALPFFCTAGFAQAAKATSMRSLPTMWGLALDGDILFRDIQLVPVWYLFYLWLWLWLWLLLLLLLLAAAAAAAVVAGGAGVGWWV